MFAEDVETGEIMETVKGLSRLPRPPRAMRCFAIVRTILLPAVQIGREFPQVLCTPITAPTMCTPQIEVATGTRRPTRDDPQSCEKKEVDGMDF